jgi:hypothetical protein
MSLEYKKFWSQSLYETVKNCPPDWEIIQLGYGLNDSNHFPKLDYTLMEQGNYYQTVSYVISNKGAQRLINEIYNNGKYKIYNNICQEADNFIFNMLRTYTYKYPYFIYPTDNTSTLHPEHLNSHIRSKSRIEYMYYQLSY